MEPLARRITDAVRLEVADNCTEQMAEFLEHQFKLEPEDIYQVNGPVNVFVFRTRGPRGTSDPESHRDQDRVKFRLQLFHGDICADAGVVLDPHAHGCNDVDIALEYVGR